MFRVRWAELNQSSDSSYDQEAVKVQDRTQVKLARLLKAQGMTFVRTDAEGYDCYEQTQKPSKRQPTDDWLFGKKRSYDY